MGIFGENKAIPAIMGASGLTREQAKTCFYYVIATYLLPDEIKKMPILAIIGPHGTGKTALLEQLNEMVIEPSMIAAESLPTLRDKLTNCLTALIDEADEINEAYLIKRYDQKTADISYKRSAKGGWRTVNVSIFGATIVARRTPFKDSATSSRSIVIRTRYKQGQYQARKFSPAQKAIFKKAANKANFEEIHETNNRIADNWIVLRKIAEALGDTEWLKYSDAEIDKSMKTFRGNQNYEPESALLLVLKETFADVPEVITTQNVLVSNIKMDLKSEFGVHLKHVQIQEMCRALGFTIVKPSGYPKVKCSRELLYKLLKEREL